MFHRVAIAAVAIIGLSACGADTDADADLPPAALEGRSVFRSAGCGACHGSNGDGGVGPTLVGLSGSEVTIQGTDSPVVADRGYLVESILDPSAKLVDGYNLPMPRANLDDSELDAVIAYIDALTEDIP